MKKSHKKEPSSLLKVQGSSIRITGIHHRLMLTSSVSALLLGVVFPVSQASAQSTDSTSTPTAAGATIAAPAAPAAPASAASVSSATSSSQRLQNVTVTGSAIATPDAETAVPVTVIQMSDMRKQGVTNVDQLMDRITANNGAGGTSAGTTGQNTNGVSSANMRGLGSQYTLVLLNGRRLPPDAATGNAPDLNTIPFAAIQRVEILRDGASALYGSDAIGGVINFITKQNYQGLAVDSNLSTSTHSGGGQSRDYGFTWGTGDINRDGYNILGTLTYQKTNSISSNNRGYFRQDDIGQGVSGESLYNLPASINAVAASNACSDGHHQIEDSGSCYFNASNNVWIVAPTEKTSLYTAGTFKLSEHNTGILSAYWGRSRNNVKSAPSDVMPNNAAPTYQGNTLYLRSVPLGDRLQSNTNDAKRVMFELKGDHLAGWNYDTAAYYNVSSLHQSLDHGYANAFQIMQGIENGLINPYAYPSTPEEYQAWKNTEIHGRVWTAKYQSYNWDGHVGHSLGDWFGAGPVDVALGADAAHEKINSLVSHLADEDFSTGISAGQGVHASRNHGSVWAELNVPVTDALSLTLSDRFNKYEGFASKTTPKVSFRYQPIDQVVFRGSYGKGFRVPSLTQSDGSELITETGTGYYDPQFCPNGPDQSDRANCYTQFNLKQGGNKNLQPESAKNWTLGMVVQPIHNLTTSVDLWWVRIDKEIVQPDAQYVLDNEPDMINRDASGHITSIDNFYQNVGNLQENGVDVAGSYFLPTDWGTWGISMNGTYVNKYSQSQNGKTINEMGYDSNGEQVNYRWQHVVTLSWSKGGWQAGIVNHYRTGFRDMSNGVGHHNRVASYTTWDGNLAYQFRHGPQITVGMTNIFNRKPPFTTQYSMFSQGYVPMYYDLMGRSVYTSLHWAF